MIEVILVIAFIWGGFYLTGWLISSISDWSKKHKEEIRNQVAEEVLSGLDIKTVIEEYKNKLAHIKYRKTDPTEAQLDRLKVQLWGRDAVLMKDCPDCKEGHLIVRKGQYGKFLGCTKYPKCKYTNKIAEAREEYKKTINERVVDDIRRAYSNL
ncbi:MAG: topoisomerase DNA-binding C4 zinc finger domain-containing protein [Candidatus Staskawiczbacteria bacterium]|jgi:DNA topoisomerase-1